MDDLVDGWTDPRPLKALEAGRVVDLMPLSELPHPVVAKALATFGEDPDRDGYRERIKAVDAVVLWEVRAGQWRGAVWEDNATGTLWLVGAGLAKGGHTDRDDFYKVLGRMDADDIEGRMPGEQDRTLLRHEVVAAALTDWQIEVQAAVADAVRELLDGADGVRVRVRHPLRREEAMAEVVLAYDTWEDEDGTEIEECLVEVLLADAFLGSDLGWRLTTRVIASVNPPMQSWDRDGDSYWTIGEPGALRDSLTDLDAYAARAELRPLEPGTVSHYAHKTHIARAYVSGTSVRARCGIVFVPFQDSERFPVCPDCAEAQSDLERAARTTN